MIKFDLRFGKPEEIKYRQSLEHHIIFPLILACGTVGCVSVWLTLAAWHALKHTGDDILIAAMVGTRLLGVISALMVIFICILKFRTTLLRSVSLEFIGVAWVLENVLLMCWFNAWHGPMLWGRDSQQLFPEWNMVSIESNVLLVVCTFVSSTCMAAPVRIHLSWLVPACGMISFFAVTFSLGSPSGSGLLLNGLCFMILVMCSLYGSYTNEGYRRQEFLAQRKVGTQQSQLATQFDGVCRILNIVCDCLIRIGSDCQILEPSTRFAATLMLIERQSLEGASFLDYIADPADKEHFKMMVTGDPTQISCSEISESAPTAGMLHVCLRDACGQIFPVDVYHTQVMHNTITQYLVGIVEKSEPSQRQCVPPQSDSQVVHTLYPEPHVIGFMQERGSQRSSTSSTEDEIRDESMSSESGSFDAEHALTSNESLVAVEFLADLQNGCPVISFTPGFTSLSGPMMATQPLMTFMEEPKDFTDGIQDMLNSFYNTCRIEVEGVVFAKPFGPMKYMIDCVSMDIIRHRINENAEDWVPGSDIVIRAVFDGIHRQRQRRRWRSGMHNSRSLQTRVSLPSISSDAQFTDL